MNIKEIVFYVHGVSSDPTGKPHDAEYEKMHEGIARSLSPSSVWPEEGHGAEWGWNSQSEDEPKGHRALADAQRRFGRKILARVDEAEDSTLNPINVATRWGLQSVRRLIMNGFSDMFYYVSLDGKWQIRYEVARQLHEYIAGQIEDNACEPAVSLTLLGHSAGSVIAFDFLYYLFSSREPWNMRSKWNSQPEKDEVIDGLRLLRRLRKAGRLRLRRLITFGSPISFLMFRNNWLIETLAKRDPLSPAHHGLESTLKGSRLEGPRWINLWDKDDPIAWPVEPIMDSPLVEDVYVDISDSVSSTHNAYWTSQACHKAIASRW